MSFLSKKLKGMEGAEGGAGGGGVFCYVNSVFAPGLDEGVGGLWRVSCAVVFSFRGWMGGWGRGELGGGCECGLMWCDGR